MSVPGRGAIIVLVVVLMMISTVVSAVPHSGMSNDSLDYKRLQTAVCDRFIAI